MSDDDTDNHEEGDHLAGHNMGPAPEVFLEHFRKMANLKRELAQVQSAVQLGFKKAKAAGINPDILKAMLKARKEEPAQIEQNMRDFFRYAMWLEMPIGQQASLFSASDDAPRPTERAKAEHKEFEARDAGFDAGVAGRAHDDNPHVPGTLLHQAWASGHSKGVEFIKEGLRTGRVRDPNEAKKAKGSGSTGGKGRGRGGAGRKRRQPSA